MFQFSTLKAPNLEFTLAHKWHLVILIEIHNYKYIKNIAETTYYNVYKYIIIPNLGQVVFVPPYSMSENL